MRVGLVDLGTNSIRYDIYEVEKDQPAKMLHRDKEMIRLGQGLFTSGEIAPEALERLLTSLSHFQNVSAKNGVDHLEAFATCALREANHSEDIRRLLKKETGIQFRVISGDEEAQLIAQGILNNDPRCRGSFALIDIGGGSTELSLCKSKRRESSVSLPLGVARVQQRFLQTIPPKSLEGLEAYFQSITPSLAALNLKTSPEFAFGSSGTIKALSRIHRKLYDTTEINLKELQKTIEMIRPMGRNEISKIPGMNPKRIDFILAGAYILEYSMKALGIKKVIHTPFALRDGILNQVTRQFGALPPLKPKKQS